MTKKQFDDTLELGLTQAVRAPWVTLDEPRRFKDKTGKENGEPKYSATFLLPNDHPDTKRHKKAVAELLKQKYGDDVSFKDGKAFINSTDEDGDSIKLKLKLPFSSGDVEYQNGLDSGKDRSFCADHTILKTSSQYPVAVFDARKRDANGEPVHVPEPEDIKKVIYGGCYVAAQIKYRTYDAVGSNPPGVTAYVQKVCFVQDGDKISGSVSGEVFSKVQGQVTDEDPTGGDDDVEL